MKAQTELQEKLTTAAFHFLSFRSRSEKEIRDYLKKKLGLLSPTLSDQQNLVEKILAGLKRSGLVDDLNFAQMWVDNRVRIQAKSLTVIKRELFQKGINKEVIERVFAKIDPNFEENKAISLISKKLKTLKGLDPLSMRDKLIAFLARRGFGWDLSRRVVDSLIKKD